MTSVVSVLFTGIRVREPADCELGDTALFGYVDCLSGDL